MKTISVIFIICFVLFQSNASSSPTATTTTAPVPDQGLISRLIEGTINILQKPFKIAYKKFQEVLNSTYGKLDNITETSLKTLIKLSSNVGSSIEQLKKDNEKSKICAKKYEPQYITLKNESEISVLDCKKGFYEEFNDSKQQIKDDYNTLYGNYEKLRLAAVSCIHLNPYSTTKCVFSNTSNYLKTTGAIFSSFIQTVLDATKDVTRLPKGFARCVFAIEADCQSKMSALEDEIKKCLS